MHRIFHEVIAALGGLLFIIFGIARQRERKRLISAGIKTEGPLLWDMFIIVGICLLIFALGLIIYQMNHNTM
ncbi:hypothetical protein ACPPVU_18050 [Mucilaginibacter sp. McL0603]|uniref:hypothetical protein n=1 Tax=Mucilaginibacter sp. McL0603 TaxID=3415670 RepID=UPI003CE87D63